MLGHAKRRSAAAAGSDASTPGALMAAAATTRSRLARRLLLLAALLLLPALTILLAALALTWDGVYPGVRVEAVALGGLDRQAATARLDAEAARWDSTRLMLTGPHGASLFTREELGLHYDREAVLAAVFAQGRDAGALDRLQAISTMARSGREVPAAFWVDETALRAGVATLAGETDIQPRDGDLRIEAGRVIVVPPVEGRGLDVDAAVARLLAAVGPDGATTVSLPVAERIQPRLNAAVLAAAQARAEALLAAPVRLTGGDLDLGYDAAQIGSWLAVRREPAADPPLTIVVERERVRATVVPLAPRVNRAPQSATYEFGAAHGAFVVKEPEVYGRVFDVERTTDAVVASLEGPGPRAVRAVTHSRIPLLTTGDIVRANRQAATTYLAGPLAFSYGERRWEVPVAQLAAWLTIEPATGVDEPRLLFDEDALSASLIALKGQIDRPAIDATYTMDDGTDLYRVTGPSQVGRRLDGPAAYRLAMGALTDGTADRTIALPVTEIRPRVTEADVAALEPERWVSVDLTAQRMYAVVGKKVVYTATISSGKRGWETPTGTFYINRRVENETMTSESIGAESYYRLENVLYTQYFTGEGHALHYSWWKEPGSFGVPTSHGCVSQTLKDSEYFWNFARVGTRVTIQGATPKS